MALYKTLLRALLNEMGGACSAYEGEERGIQGLGRKT